VEANQTVLDAGLSETASALREWRLAPTAVLLGWLAGSLAIAALLLLATLTVASLATPRASGALIGVPDPARFGDLLHVLLRNSMVLALHSLACVAGFLAKRSLPMQAQLRTGVDRWVHEHAGGLALAFVACATAFSLGTQAWVLGHAARDVATTFGAPVPALLACLLPHAIPELAAVFLPLSAFLLAARAGNWDQLLAATTVTTSIAAPVIVAAAAIETYVSPHLVKALLL
jgi:hypothetical protein